ncbi:hypothetical protein SSPO_067280 [Streptomyces antimycoticus]|uniref:Uncharacterized protein n=1 Tax=Streptomyces antimycoticus TaxID=68175 RepID=A0A499UTP1_9ACTN|nr:hypothetical protein SSPO_067280 [Streptomyces antimycoticus]
MVTCRVVHGAKPAKPARPAKSVELTEVGKATAGVKADGKKVTVAPKDGARGHGDVCAIPAFPGKPGKVCTVVIIKGNAGTKDDDSAVLARPTTPTKPGKPTTPSEPSKPSKPGKPSKTCEIVVIKEGHRADDRSADATSAAVGATRS